ncbi:Hsp20/alpha crystallin family protein [Schlegelella aquatica]|uniref:Hsp20/alpha crystallin family protein n=1 Tax=Caldimonas aquatica TaxID=376175 RepID=UPI003750FDB1
MFASTLIPGGLFSDFDRLRRELDELFGWVGLPTSIRSVAPGTYPALNIGTTPSSVEVYAFAPGIDPSKVEVTVDRGVLTIAGERASTLPDEQDRKVSVYARERATGAFKRAVSLPEDIDPDRVSATYRDGVLHIRIARRESAQPKRIAIQ